MRPVSIGVQAAAMIDCDARVPLLVFAKRHKLHVKDPVDLAAVRRGRLIHAAFDAVATGLGEAGTLGSETVVTATLSTAIASALPDLDTGAVAAQASSLSTTITAAVAAAPAAEIRHECFVSVLLTPGVKASGRVDTVIDGKDGWILVERKTGERRPWHARQVQLYADMVEAIHPGQRVARLELWYSGREPGVVPVASDCGDRLARVRSDAKKGIDLDSDSAIRLCASRCLGCPRYDCGIKQLQRQTT